MARKWVLAGMVAAVASAAVVFVMAQPVHSSTMQEVPLLRLSLPSLKLLYSRLSQLSVSVNIPSSAASMPQTERLRLLREESEWKNSLVLSILPDSVHSLPHFMQTWVRNGVAAYALYIILGLVWSWYAYVCFGDLLFKPGTIPQVTDVLEQIKVACVAMPLYALLPTVTEWAAEHGYTRAYPRISNVGLPMYLLYFTLYMTSVEFCVYWMHRLLHEIKMGYRFLHYPHHKYNKEHTMSPFAGLAFHAMDGILQALPYTLTLFYCPMHFMTHELLLFATAVWTANIHDNIHGNTRPVLGAGYHTIHHTLYKYNYGHYFIYMDWMFGSLLSPEEEAAGKHKLHSE